jgi:5'-deoxynucleotidase YfbR-like HD superfamily hydrolase
MNKTTAALKELFERIPRRHNTDNVKEIYSIVDEYETLLQEIESESPVLEKKIAPFFDGLEPIRGLVKKSNDNKASKKMKDELFDEASGLLKDSMQSVSDLYKPA